MFVWEMLFALVVIYQGYSVSINDQYRFMIQPIISIVLIGIATYFVITRVFIYHALALSHIAIIICSSLFLGILFRILNPITITTDKKWKRYLIRGSYMNFIPTFALLGINYYIGYLRLTQKDFFWQGSEEEHELLIAFAIIMGTWIVMEACLIYKYLRYKSTEQRH